ncbi:MAG: molybdate ABC transporter permease subunit [Alphaproteobacteria bacterium]|nr:molybdate ABC transporter permease subunit [Alphaproteobacteria bacterium]
MPLLSPFETEALLLSLKVSATAVAFSLPLGILVAWVLARTDFPGKDIFNALVHLPLVLPPVVVGYLLLVLLGRRGLIGGWLDAHLGIVIAFTWTGAAVAAAVMAFPLMVRAIRLSLETVDRRLEQVARTLGASPLRVMLSVTLPLTLPGIVAGVALAFARCLGEFGATITFVSNIPGVSRTLPLALYTAINTPGGEADAARLVVISLVLAFVAIGLSEVMARRVARMVA